jgi:hypothetical protein
MKEVVTHVYVYRQFVHEKVALVRTLRVVNRETAAYLRF